MAPASMPFISPSRLRRFSISNARNRANCFLLNGEESFFFAFWDAFLGEAPDAILLVFLTAFLAAFFGLEDLPFVPALGAGFRARRFFFAGDFTAFFAFVFAEAPAVRVDFFVFLPVVFFATS